MSIGSTGIKIPTPSTSINTVMSTMGRALPSSLLGTMDCICMSSFLFERLRAPTASNGRVMPHYLYTKGMIASELFAWYAGVIVKCAECLDKLLLLLFG